MCGEIDENLQINQELLERFNVMAKMLGAKPLEPGQSGPVGLAEADGRAAYMDQLFQLGLVRALTDANATEEGEAVDAIASQAIAFARLAGFIAGQLPPDADLFRSVVEAVAAGHAETGRLVRQYRDAQDQAHGHSHSHDDGHHHHH